MGFRGEIEHFADCVLRRTQPLTSLDEGYKDHVLIEAIWQSATTGRAVKLE